MADWLVFQSDKGGVAIDTDLISGVWEGLEEGTTVIEQLAAEPILVRIDFNVFIRDYLDHFDLRPKPKKKPRATKKATRGQVVQLKDWVN